MPDVQEQIRAAAALLRSYGAVAVLGAGVSAARYPMTAQLPPLLWQAIEDTPLTLAELRKRAGIGGSAKQILGSGGSSLRLGWQLVREYPEARRAFQTAFAALDADREPSLTHFELVRLIDAGLVEAVVSYNWDSCLERAWERTYGTPLPDGVLHKPHGDVADVEASWVLPDEDGIVTPDVHAHVSRLVDRPRVLMVLGYSGSDQGVVQALLDPLEARWPVVRVGPSAAGEGAIQTTADEAMSVLTTVVAPSNGPRGWKYVTFQRSRSFLAALRGERLRPTDVDACPELAIAPRIAQRLRDSSFATLSGSSGTGKSISAFHAARRLNRAGWRVVELIQPGVATSADVVEFSAMPGPVVAIVDDAQAISREVRSSFESAADATHAVLLVSTERLESRDGESISQAEATATLNAFCRRHIETVAPMLTQLDDRVRWSMGAETPEQRLDLAQRTAAEPWLFMYVASGGERRMATVLDRLVEDVQSALVFAVVCITQMTSRDAGVIPGEIRALLSAHAPTVFKSDGRFIEVRQDATLVALANERLVRETNGRIRAPHVRIAERALQDLAQRGTNELGVTVRRMVRATLLDRDVPVLGKYWLLRSFDRIDTFRYRWASELVDAEVSTSLVRQCVESAPGVDRGVAMNLVWASQWLRPLSEDDATKLTDAIITWLPGLGAHEVNGFRWLVGSIRSRHPEQHGRIIGAIPASVVAERLSTAGTRQTAMDWDWLLGELIPSDNQSDWKREFDAAIDVGALTGWLRDRDEFSHPLEIWDLISKLADLAPRTARLAFEACAEEIRHAFEEDMVDATKNFDWVFSSLIYFAIIADSPGAYEKDQVEGADDDNGEVFRSLRTRDGQELAASLLEVMTAIDWERAGRSVIGKRLYETSNLDMLLGWLSHLSTDITDRLALAVPVKWWLELMDEAQSEREGAGIEAISHILAHLSAGELGREVVRRFLTENSARVAPFPASLIKSFPELAAEAIADGRSASVDGPRAFGWTELAGSLEAVAAVNDAAARRWMLDMVSALAEAIESPQVNNLEGVQHFVEVADALQPEVLDEAIQRVDTHAARGRWSARLLDAHAEATVLLKRVCAAPSPAAAVASDILAAYENASSADRGLSGSPRHP